MVTATVRLWSRAMMKNTTVAVPDDVDRAARIRAAEEGRSVEPSIAQAMTDPAYHHSSSGRAERNAEVVSSTSKGVGSKPGGAHSRRWPGSGCVGSDSASRRSS